MGQFSWLTKFGEQIRNEHHQGQKVWMVFKSTDGTKIVVREDKYEGYGMFGGLDYYEVLFEMNKDKMPYMGNLSSEQRRSIGVDICYDSNLRIESKPEYPQLFTHVPGPDEINHIDWFEPNPDDPDQGWVVEEQDEDDDWYDEDYLHDNWSNEDE